MGGADRLGGGVPCVDRPMSARVPACAPPVHPRVTPHDQADPDRHRGNAVVVMDIGGDSLSCESSGQPSCVVRGLRWKCAHIQSVAVAELQVNGLVLLVVRLFSSRISVQPGLAT